MELLEQRILTDGKVLPGGILKVDGFLNHQIDPQLLYEMALEFKRLYDGTGINKILTIEASGIAMAAMTGYVFSCPLVFAKKSKTKNISNNVYSVEVASFTHGNTNTVVVSKEYLSDKDRVLIVDDFLATGAALVGLKALVEQAGGVVVGAASRWKRSSRAAAIAALAGAARRVAREDRLDGRSRPQILLRIKTPPRLDI